MSATFRDWVNPQILTQPVYEGGKPIERVAAEFGLDPSHVAKLASNENFLGPSPMAVRAMQDALEKVHLYPDGNGTFLIEAIAKKRGVSPDQVILGNGSNEVLELVARAFLNNTNEAVFGEYGFIVYRLVTLLHGAAVTSVSMHGYAHDFDALLAAISEKTRIVFIASPNNPTGLPDDPGDVYRFVEALPDHVLLVYDEAYAEYLDAPVDLLPYIKSGRKILCTRTFSKIYGLGGLRLGYGYGDPDLIALLNRIREPFNVNMLALAAGEAALDDEDFVLRSRAGARSGIQQLTEGLKRLGLKIYPAASNFVLCEVQDPQGKFVALQKEGVIVRPLAPYGLKNHLRITVGSHEENERLLAKMKSILQKTTK